MNKPIIIIGVGAWGQALAYCCRQANPDVQITLLSRHAGRPQKNDLSSRLQNDSNLYIHSRLSEIIQEDHPVVIATPSDAISGLLHALKTNNHKGEILCASKGFIGGKHVLYPHELYQKIYPNRKSFAYLYGPTFADEVLNGQPTQALLATTSRKSRKLWQKTLQHDHFQTIANSDLIGAAWCSVFKNIVAIVAGCMNANKLGCNAQALLISHAIRELKSILHASQGKQKTALTIAGIGDMILTATSQKSRNYQYGQSLIQPSKDHARTIEGITNLKLIHQKLPAKHEKKGTIISLAENCLAQPKRCRDLIIHWLQHKARCL